jgi:hypothetical protein
VTVARSNAAANRTTTEALARIVTLRNAIMLVTPVAVYYYVKYSARAGFTMEEAIAGIAAGVIVIVAARRPDRCLLLLAGLLPFQLYGLAWLYALGVPGQIVRPLGGWKEALGLAVVVAGFRGYRHSRRSLDRLDRVCIWFMIGLSAYALFPRLFSTGAPVDSTVRSLTFRGVAGFVLLLLACRHLDLPPDFGRRLRRTLLITGSIVAGVAVIEFFLDTWWNNFSINTIRLVKYQQDILNQGVRDPTDLRFYTTIAGARVVRVGSVFANPLTLGFYLVIGWAVALEQVVRSRASALASALVVLFGLALMFTQTRSAVLAGVVAAALAFRPAPGRLRAARVRYLMICVVGLAIALPVAGSTGLTERSTGAVNGTDTSAQAHQGSFGDGINAISAHPLGTGLGTSAGQGQRFGTTEVVTENYYLQVGVETGVPMMLLFFAATILIARGLTSVSTSRSSTTASAARGAFVGIAVGAFFLHTWNDISTSWTLWMIAGLVLGAGPLSRRERRRSGDMNLEVGMLYPRS